MGEQDVRKIVLEEIGNVFTKMQQEISEVKQSQSRIERVLLGDKDYNDEGMASQIHFAYQYARKNTESKIIERGCEAIDQFERYKKNGFWEILEQIIDSYKIWKWLVAFTGIGTLVGVINLILFFIGKSV